MNEIKFDKNAADRDRFEQDYIWSHPWLRLLSGEVCFTTPKPDPSDRRFYPEYGVTIFMPGDSHAPKVYTPEGNLIPTAQMDINGNPYLLWDHRHNQVKELRGYSRNQNTQIPTRLRNFAAYWAAHDAYPIASPIVFTPPNKFTPEEKEFVQALKPVSVITKAMGQEEGKFGPERSLPSIQDIREAIASSVAPMAFVQKFSYEVLRSIIESPTASIKREVKTIPFGITKG